MNRSILPFALLLLLPATAGLAEEADHPACAEAAPQASGAGPLLAQARDALRQGQYCLGLQTAKLALAMAQTAGERARARGMAGLAYQRMGYYAQAESALRTAIETGEGGDAERARWMAALAELSAAKDSTEQARQWYAQALRLENGQDRRLRIAIRLGQARLAPPDQKLELLHALGMEIAALDDAGARAEQYLDLAGQAAELGNPGLRLAYASYAQAKEDAGQDPRLQAEALGGLAKLYESQKRLEEALRLNGEAVLAAQSINAQDLLIGLLARQGRLHKARGQDALALAAYQGAVDNIEAIRQDIPVEYTQGRSSFQDRLAPVYLGLADLQLSQASKLDDQAKAQALLRRARDTVELTKQAELQDFLGSRCAVERAKTPLLENIEPKTAILYPILLDDRLELLVSRGGEIRQFTQPVDAGSLGRAVCALATTIQNSERVSRSLPQAQALAKQLHGWLIAPAQPWLKEHGIETLVVVPDGVLRLIPPAVLYDGEKYLIEEYRLAISPGLTLYDPRAIHPQGIKTLLAGMSEPGPVVEQLEPSLRRALLAAGRRGAGEFFQACQASKAAPGGRVSIARDADLARPEVTKFLEQKLKLPAVEQEIDTLRGETAGTALLNADFTLAGFEKQILENDYSVVHIASHGVFGGRAEDSFIMAYDDTLDMAGLEKLFSAGKFKQAPVELLTLSACHTAEGDDRAPLGLSGIAIKARVRSVLGSLWAVNDAAASVLMVRFYRELARPGTGKAQALQKAQTSLMQDPRFAHPYFWSPFILVGNWL